MFLRSAPVRSGPTVLPSPKSLWQIAQLDWKTFLPSAKLPLGSRPTTPEGMRTSLSRLIMLRFSAGEEAWFLWTRHRRGDLSLSAALPRAARALLVVDARDNAASGRHGAPAGGMDGVATAATRPAFRRLVCVGDQRTLGPLSPSSTLSPSSCCENFPY